MWGGAGLFGYGVSHTHQLNLDRIEKIASQTRTKLKRPRMNTWEQDIHSELTLGKIVKVLCLQAIASRVPETRQVYHTAPEAKVSI